MGRRFPHIGLRTVKTGLAVALALFFAELRGSPALIFAGIGAIVAMNRTVGDAFESCRSQFFGILLGAGFGAVFVHLFEGARYVGVGLGIIMLILLCVQLRLQFAVSLACIVFVAICLSPTDEAFYYGVNRLLDTIIGLATALAVNVLIKPYNNRARIVDMLTHFHQSIPSYIEERVLHGRYPDLSPLRDQLDRIADELSTFEKQKLFRQQDHAGQIVYLRGCEQLAHSIWQELSALCAMDECSRLSPDNAARLAAIGLSAPEGAAAPPHTTADVVGNYHLDDLLRAYTYLASFLQSV
ncbi:MAG: aromatic acid exporter family protein [Eubacteriales bacterium]|nr:aromatic acid exporter family protein [Eubacteriales bacterium]